MLKGYQQITNNKNENDNCCQGIKFNWLAEFYREKQFNIPSVILCSQEQFIFRKFCDKYTKVANQKTDSHHFLRQIDSSGDVVFFGACDRRKHVDLIP